MVRSEIVNTFLLPRVKAISSLVEDLNSYIMAVVSAAETSGFEGEVPAGSPHTAKSTPSGQGSPFVREQAGDVEELVRPCDDHGRRGGNRRQALIRGLLPCGREGASRATSSSMVMTESSPAGVNNS
jgi:hypothetical protein